MPSPSRRHHALRDAGLSALVALGLFGVMIGLKTDAGPTSLVLTWRPWAVVIAVATVFVGRLAMLGWLAARPAGTPTPRRLATLLSRASPYLTPVLLVFAIT